MYFRTCDLIFHFAKYYVILNNANTFLHNHNQQFFVVQQIIFYDVCS